MQIKVSFICMTIKGLFVMYMFYPRFEIDRGESIMTYMDQVFGKYFKVNFLVTLKLRANSLSCEIRNSSNRDKALFSFVKTSKAT